MLPFWLVQQMLPNGHKHLLNLALDVRIAEPQHLVAERFECGRALCVVLPLLVMNGSVDFDHNPPLGAAEINDEPIDRMLSPDVQAQHAMAAQVLPQQRLGCGWLMAQLPGACGFGGGCSPAHAAPSPGPSPVAAGDRRGEYSYRTHDLYHIASLSHACAHRHSPLPCLSGGGVGAIAPGVGATFARARHAHPPGQELLHQALLLLLEQIALPFQQRDLLVARLKYFSDAALLGEWWNENIKLLYSFYCEFRLCILRFYCLNLVLNFFRL